MRGKLLGALLGVSVLVLAACGGDEPAVPDPGEIAESVQEGLADAVPPVATVDNNFAPSRFPATAGEEITVNVSNNGQNSHSFTIDSLDVDTGVLAPGDSAEVTFTMPDQEAQFYCTVHGAEVMSGVIEPL